MKRRLLPLLLALSLLLTPAASALTVDHAKEILETYYLEEIPEEVLEQPTIEEMLQALGDPYTEYYAPGEFDSFLSSLEDVDIVGIGIVCQYLSQGILISEIAKGSPAEDAGLQPGDCIISVDGHDVRGAAESDIDGWIRGEEGTEVTLEIQRGEDLYGAVLTRRPVYFPMTALDKVEDGVGWITCDTFGSATFAQFYDIITTYDSEVEYWVVDLRENSGGDAMAAVLSAGCFAGFDQGVYLRDKEGAYANYLFDLDYAAISGYFDGEPSAFDENGYLTQAPVFVLTSQSTASGAELFCSAIRDSGAGLIIGERTFGKGIAQTVFSSCPSDEHRGEGASADCFTDGEYFKVTTERAFGTQGATYDQIGILPHLMLDSALAGQAAALLCAPVEEDNALLLVGLNDISVLTDTAGIPLSMLSDPEYAEAASALLCALPPEAVCFLNRDGESVELAPAAAAAELGLDYTTRSFPDTAGSPYQQQIDTLGVYGILRGQENGLFLPQEELDRASLCALLVQALRYPVAGGVSPFEDVPADAWYAPHVNALYELGIIEGYDDGLFHPEEPVSHEQFAVIMARIAQWVDMDYYEYTRPDGIYGDLLPEQAELDGMYPDYAPWAREAVCLVNEFAWTDLAAEEVDAKGATSREEAAATLYLLLYYGGVLNV